MSNPDFDRLLDQLAAAGLGAAANGLRKLKPENQVERLVVGALADYVERYGLEGYSLLKDRLVRAAVGVGGDVDLDLTDLRTASDLLAVLQQREGDQRQAVFDALAKAGEVLGAAVGGLVRGAVGLTLP